MSNILIDNAWEYILAIEYNLNRSKEFTYIKNDQKMFIHDRSFVMNMRIFINQNNSNQKFLNDMILIIKRFLRDYDNLHTCHSNEIGDQLTFHHLDFRTYVRNFVQIHKKVKRTT